MAIDGAQQVLRIIAANRSPQSFFAGGSVLNRHGPRLSNDQDIFLSDEADANEVAGIDVRSLEAVGFTVATTKQYEGFVEAVAGNAAMGSTRLQWTKAAGWSFFAPLPDADYGFRLHMADLCVNKALAAGGRCEVRDYVDLFLIQRYVMPLWVLVWAAPGKDEKWTPIGLLERIARQNAFKQSDIDTQIVSLNDLSAVEMGQTLAAAIDEARQVFTQLASQTAGKLAVDAQGHCVTHPALDAQRIKGAALGWLEARRGGALPSSPDMDHDLVLRLIAEFGVNATKLMTAPD